MKPLIITQGRSRLIFTPENGGLTMDLDGAGLTQILSVADREALIAMLIVSVRRK